MRSHIVVPVLLALSAGVLAPATVQAACHPTITGDRPAAAGTSHFLAHDGDLATFFDSTHNNWQYLQIDFNCVGELRGLRRYMTLDGSHATGSRGQQGEGASYSVDGVTWTTFTRNTATGWAGYVNYLPHAWHSLPYGWSAWLELTTPVRARYVRFQWDDGSDALNEVEVNFTPPPPQPLPQTVPGQHYWPTLAHDAARRGFTDLSGPEDFTILEPWPFTADDAVRSAPVIGSDGTAYFGSDDTNVYALRSVAPNTAALEKWRFAAGSAVRGAPALKDGLEASPVRLYFGSEGGEVFGLDPRSGALVWRQAVGAAVTTSPAVVLPAGSTLARVYVTLDDGTVKALFETGNAFAPTVSQAWQVALRASPAPAKSPALSPDASAVYATDGEQVFYALDALTGNEVCRARVVGSQRLTSPLVDPDGYVYVGSDNGSLYSFLPAPSVPGGPCQVRWSLAGGGPVDLTPALMPGGRIVFIAGVTVQVADRIAGSLACTACSSVAAPWVDGAQPVVDGTATVFLPGRDQQVHALRGGARYFFPTDRHGVFTAPALDGNGRLYVGSADHNLYVLQESPAFKVAFDSTLQQASNTDLYTLREVYGATESRRTVRLTEGASLDAQPTYSTDGRWLAFVSDRDGSPDVFMGTSGALEAFNVTRSGPGLPFSAGSAENEPAFSPLRASGESALMDRHSYLALTQAGDASRILFVELDVLRQTSAVSVVSLGDFLGRQVPGGTTIALGAQQRQAAFSPDGRFLAYSACTDGAGTHLSELVLIDLRARQAFTARVTLESLTVNGSCQAKPADFAPAFSPDSHYVVYQGGGADLKITDLQNFSPLVRATFPGLDVRRPAWSPDGTEIAFAAADSRSRLSLRIGKGPNYGTGVVLSTALRPPAGTSFAEPEYHPRRFPRPRLSLDCAVDQANPAALQPTDQRPRQPIEIRGCGFDLRFPENNHVFFTHAKFRNRWVEASISSARVDVAQGLGVLVVTVPDLAGDGPVAVVTPFGKVTTAPFHVIPLPMALVRDKGIVNGKIRVLGYGFQIQDPSHPRLNKVFFTDPAGNTQVEGTVLASELQECGTAVTPCVPGAPLEDGQRKVEWLEVQVPAGVGRGPVRATNDDVAQGFACCTFDLLHPEIRLSRDSGCEGDSSLSPPIVPVRFTVTGTGFPRDDYFGYTAVDVLQINPPAQAPVTAQPGVPLASDGSFTALDVPVLDNDGGVLTIRAREPNLAVAVAEGTLTAPFPDLPIIFVPGTSGTFLKNHGGTFSDSFCLIGGDYLPGQNVWIDERTIERIAAGCDDYLNAIKLQSSGTPDGNDPAVFPQIDVGDPIGEVSVPTQAPKPAYKPLFDFITGTGPGQMGRPQFEPDLLPAVGVPLPPVGSPDRPAPNAFYFFRLDWRKGYESQAARLSDLVDRVAQTNPRGKVLIITQSVGGPVTQYYLRTRPQAPSKVDQVISLAGGFMGVLKSYEILQLGSDWGLNAQVGPFTVGVDPDKVQELAQDWPTAFWQMPQADWFDDPNGICPNQNCAFIFEDGRDADDDRNSTVEGHISNANDSYDFILHALNDDEDEFSSGPSRAHAVNNAKFLPAQNGVLRLPAAIGRTCGNPVVHARGLGDWRCGTDGVFVQRFIGGGVPTTVGMRYFEETVVIWVPVPIQIGFITIWIPIPIWWSEDRVEPETGDGDGTVPLRSAVGILDRFDDRMWGLNGTDHLPIAHKDFVHRLIGEMAAGKVCSTLQHPDPAVLAVQGNPLPVGVHALTAAPAGLSGPPEWWEMRVRGRASVLVEDATGRRTGFDGKSGRQQWQIPEILFETGRRFTLIHLPGQGHYTITLAADGTDIDSVDVSLRALQGMKATRAVTFLDLPFGTSTRARLDWDGAHVPDRPAIAFEPLGDGRTRPWPADGMLQGDAARDTTRPTSVVRVQNGRLTVSADDSGGSGLKNVFWGIGRGHEMPRLYTGPVTLPAGTSHVWAFANDAAGNVQSPASVWEACDLPYDFDGDGQVSVKDLERAAGHWGRALPLAFDVTRDRRVDVVDLQRVAAGMGKRCGRP